jgi:hypothetical protein
MKNFGKYIGSVVGIFAGIMIASGSVARAEDLGELRTVSGEATFIRHRTVTPQYCTESGCLKGKTYWALSVRSGGVRYELDQILSEGEDSEPDTVTVGGVVVHQGVHVSITARTSMVNRSFVLLSDLREIVILDRGVLPMPFVGWTCQSVGEAQPVYVDVYQASRDGDYSMRVQSVSLGEDNPRTVASFDAVNVAIGQSDVRFVGADKRVQMDLTIDARGGEASEKDSLLKVVARAPSYGTSFPVESSVKLLCGRTR